MTKKEKLFSKAKNSPGGLTFNELCRLAELAGFVFRNQSGSHKIYKHPATGEMMNLQPYGKHAKKYQVMQLLDVINKHGLISEV